jgi:hypothetical protein
VIDLAEGEPVGTRLLILDTSSDPPRWLIVSVTLDTDTRPAHMAGSRYTDWAEVTAWCRQQVGPKVALIPAAAMVWRIDER